MEILHCNLASFSVIGKEGSTNDQNKDFISALWEDANGHFDEVANLAKKQEGKIAGIWGCMSDFTRQFLPWTNFSEGYYLAGVEVEDDAVAPANWIKWTIPASTYIYLPVENNEMDVAFSAGLAYIKAQGLTLVGAVQEFHCPQTHQLYLFYPVGR